MMTTKELATRIYIHVSQLNRNSEGWDSWDDRREIDFIQSLIENQHITKINEGSGFQNSGIDNGDGLSGFRG